MTIAWMLGRAAPFAAWAVGALAQAQSLGPVTATVVSGLAVGVAWLALRVAFMAPPLARWLERK